ncbi:cell wall metabolism sensor histidine kinase WalK [uncultured Paenibacillus sp.]|uniref:sensor histidine kinase n=1 Tax=uncultured Paenibacillus sp. TaxID=227322 RepID=UPI0015AEA71C|nr:HAMP domain-containing sensor histidine kinase [uncultured Paenibacillus sp.]
MRIKSLTLRIWIILSIVILIIALVTSLAFLLVTNGFEDEDSTNLLELTHQIVLDSLKENPGNESTLEAAGHHYHHFVFNLTDGQFTPILGDAQIPDAFVGKLESLVNQDKGQVTDETLGRTHYLIRMSPMGESSYLISYMNTDEREDVRKIILIAMLVTLLSLPISKLIANNIAKPLKKLEAYTKQVANKEWNSELEIRSEDEIGRLAKAMKEMKETLRIADEEERKFLQSVSHDLKTPVMVIMGYAQEIIDGMYEDSPEESATIIKNEANRLEKKIKQILYLNTLDYVLGNEKESEEIYLDKLLTYLVTNFQSINPELSWSLALNTNPAVIVGSQDRIRVSLENVLENQLRFAKENVEVSLMDSERFWIIEITNDGPSISEQDRHHIFKSLYKGSNGNFGLGLSISSKIINYYGGGITAENREDRVCFRIIYPKSGYM